PYDSRPSDVIAPGKIVVLGRGGWEPISAQEGLPYLKDYDGPSELYIDVVDGGPQGTLHVAKVVPVKDIKSVSGLPLPDLILIGVGTRDKSHALNAGNQKTILGSA